jgi:periplasmic divalent cation tolerance protein
MELKKIVLTTTSSNEEAQQIAHALIQRRLAACVNITGPVESFYRWEDEVETSAEWLLVIKTTAAAFAGVRDCIRELHSYELPECIELAIENGSSEYLKWIEANVG